MKLLRTLGLAYLYYPHLWMMRAGGPYVALFLSRVVAAVHWLTTLCGTERQTRAALAAAQPEFQTTASIASMMYRHLVVKYQNFVEWYLYPTRRGRRFVRETYRDIEGTEHLDRALTEGNGAIVLVYHYGPVKMVFPALQNLGYCVQQHVFRGATYAGKVYDWMAVAAMKKLADMEQSTGLPVLYHRPLTALVTLLRCLRRNEIVAINGDGMMGDDFAEVSFLNGTMSLPAGAAELAARSGAPILPLFVESRGLYGHRIVIHSPIRVVCHEREHVAAAVGQCAALLEQYVRRQPWSWWTWRRVKVTRQADGRIAYQIQALRGEMAISDPPRVHPVRPEATAQTFQIAQQS